VIFEPFESAPYRISRVEIGRVGAVQYIRTFWWILTGIPICGLLLLFFFRSTFGVLFGSLLLLWPITIPGRIILLTWKSAQKLTQQTTARVTEEAIYLSPPMGTGTRIPASWIKKIWAFGDILVVEGRLLNFVLIRKSAFTADQIQTMMQTFRTRRLMPKP